MLCIPYAVCINNRVLHSNIMARSKVTAKFQITIPRKVRDKLGLRPGELVDVESSRGGTILVKRFSETRTPLATLIGKKLSSRHIPVEELEAAAESR